VATGLDILTAALWRIGIVSEDETASGAALSKGIDTMNRMAQGWAARGVDVSWTVIGAADEFPLGAEYEDHFVWLLADTLTDDYANVAPLNTKKIYDAWDIFKANFGTVPASQIDEGILKLPSRNYTSWWFR
jgi:hypothetical protein